MDKGKKVTTGHFCNDVCVVVCLCVCVWLSGCIDAVKHMHE